MALLWTNRWWKYHDVGSFDGKWENDEKNENFLKITESEQIIKFW